MVIIACTILFTLNIITIYKILMQERGVSLERVLNFAWKGRQKKIIGCWELNLLLLISEVNVPA